MQIPLEVVQPLSSEELNGIQLSLAGDHQFVNASLAVSLCKCWLRRTRNMEKLFVNVSWLPCVFVSHILHLYLNFLNLDTHTHMHFLTFFRLATLLTSFLFYICSVKKYYYIMLDIVIIFCL